MPRYGTFGWPNVTELEARHGARRLPRRPAPAHAPSSETVRDLAEARVPETSQDDHDETAIKIADCDRKLAQYKTVLDAGGSSLAVAAWIAETEAEARHAPDVHDQRRPDHGVSTCCWRHAMSGGDQVIRWPTALTVLGVAVVAAVASYVHAYDLVRAHRETAWTARTVPLTVDGLIYASSMVMLDRDRRGRGAP
jgi:Protein of unknown function (DUF2637)